MQHKCPMCGYSFSSHYTPLGGQARFLTSLGTELIWIEGGGSPLTTPDATALQRDEPRFLLPHPFGSPFEPPRPPPLLTTLLSGLASLLSRSRKRSKGPQHERDLRT